MKVVLISLVALTILIVPVSSWSMAFDVTNSSDGGYVIAGATGLNYKWSYAWLIRVDSQGNEIWNKTYSGECRSQAWNVVRVEDGYVLGGVTGCHGNDAWIVKVDESGNVVWQKKYGYKGKGDSATSIVGEGRGVVASITIAPCNGSCINEDVWLVKLDGDGKEVWKRVFSYRDYDSIKRLKRTSDGGYIGVGTVGDYIGGIRPYSNYDLWVLKVDGSGREEWSKVFDFGFDDIAWDVTEVGDGYIVVGEAWNTDVKNFTNASNAVKAVILKLDRDGNLEWTKFVELGKVTVGWSVITDNGNITVAGSGGGENGSFVWVSAMGKWLKVLRGNFTFLWFVFGTVRTLKVSDGYILISSKECNGACVWLSKLNFDGKLVWERIYAGLKDIKFGVKERERSSSFSDTVVLILAVAILMAYLIYRMT